MPLPYEQLTQILGIEASDYPPEHETTPEFMNQKFNELLVNDKELLKQINDCSKNKVLTTLAEVNNPNLESGIYSAEGEGVRMSFSTSVSSDYYVLIVNKHRLNPGYGTQLAIPYDNAAQRGIYYRICAAGTWSPWRTIATPESEMITLNGFTPSFTQCKVSKVGNVYTFNFSIVTTGAIPSGTVIATLPTGFYPTYNFHIHPWAYNADVSYHLRAWVTTDGNITLHGGETLQPDVQLEFSRTMIFE